MAKRVPRPAFRTFEVTVPVIDGEIDPKVKELIEGALRDIEAASRPPVVRPPKVRLRNRNIRKADRFPCTQKAVIGGREIVGCGRTYGSAATLAAHMDLVKGIWADKTRWPNGCLDAIVPNDLRDSR